MAGPHAGNRNRPAYSGQSRFRFPKQIIELFAPRPPLEFKPPVKRRKLPPMTGIAKYVSKFGTLPPVPASSSSKKKEEQKYTTATPATPATSKSGNEKPIETENPQADKTEKASGAETNVDMDVEEKENDSGSKKEAQAQGGDDGGEMNMDMDVEDESESAKSEGEKEMDVEEKPAAVNSKSEKPVQSKAKSENVPTAAVPVPFETPARRRLRKHEKKVAVASKLISEGLSKWDPFANSEDKTREARHTLFVAGFERNLPEARLRCEFEIYGRISKVRIPVSKKSGIPCKYGFIEFEKESSMKSALDGCRGRGKKIDGKRLTVDLERGRTMDGWVPNRLKHPAKRKTAQITPKPELRPPSRSRY